MENNKELTGQEIEEIISIEPLSEATIESLAQIDTEAIVAREIIDRQADGALEVVVDIAGEYECEATIGFGDDGEPPPHRNGKLPEVIECMLFVSPDPLSAEKLAETLEIEAEAVEKALETLDADLQSRSGLQLMRVAGGYQICTRPEFADYCSAILQPSAKRLSKAALETLAVVAYRQPCTVPEIESVRGVNVGGLVKTLCERGLVKEAGKKQTPGRPMMYATTPEFLEYFGLNDLSELPDIDMLATDAVSELEEQMEAIMSESMPTPIVDDEEEECMEDTDE